LYPRVDKRSKVQSTLSGASIEIGAEQAYAADVEKGTPNRRAFPYMGPALADTKDETLRILAIAVRRVLS
jgi:hypothetical protein